MEKVNNERIVKNENLFRALVCIPPAILFVLLSINSIATSGILIFQVIFILLAAYFSLSALSNAAQYTNERYDGNAEPFFKNQNLSKSIKFLPIAIIFTFVAYDAVITSTHVVFQTVYVILAFALVLTTIAYAAFYTNDRYEENAEH
ncbi:hypothetical protein [Thalassotalea profundi]|uniref:Uncharacterized protein n=1 Tax=Thalassotalea profundi TaxID=2036687 RepID=A0ABQ3ICA8_9GAMM|nr:hypothetical protein [Thalassotalea profundi]GHE78963.1 hypothetical protein GCM10011501_03590 [Thalassotalea profundi]